MAAGYRKCPDCGQDVLKSATECKNCGYSFVGSAASRGGEGEEKKFARVEIYTDQNRIQGAIILGGSGFDFRLSDFLNTKAQRFFPILDAQIFGLDGVKLRHHEVLMLSKEAVKMLVPLEEPDRKEKTMIEGIVSSATHVW